MAGEKVNLPLKEHMTCRVRPVDRAGAATGPVPAVAVVGVAATPTNRIDSATATIDADVLRSSAVSDRSAT